MSMKAFAKVQYSKLAIHRLILGKIGRRCAGDFLTIHLKDEVYAHPTAPFMKDMRTVSPDVLCDMVRRRLHKLLPFTPGSTDVRKVFEEIILSEVKVACDGIPDVLCTTLINPREKQRLHRRLLGHIMIVSEQLFLHYLHKMDWSKSHSLFSEEANLTRCKAQLLLDCSKFFNVFSARHYLIAEIKELEGNEPDEVTVEQIAQFSQHTDKKKVLCKISKQSFTMKYFIRLGRPDTAVKKVQRETDLMQIKSIQGLDLEKVHKLFPKSEDYTTFTKNVQCEAVTTPCSFRHEEEQNTEEENSYAKCTLIKKSVSCPNLRIGDLLADELRIIFRQYPAECPDILSKSQTEVEGNPVSDDLRRLIGDATLQSSDHVQRQYPDEEIPPLISAIGPGYRNPAKRQKMEALLQSLNKKSEDPREIEKTKTSSYPQAFTVDVQVPNRPLVRRADVQASDRVFIHLTEIQKYPPIYNDFASEIESATVKKLDRNLYVGQELEEVYTELVKNLSTNHLRFDQDLEFEPYATKLDFSVCTASSTLTKKTNQRVINKKLDSLAAFSECESLVQHMPADKEASRVYNSWLVWWKSVVNTDDYMKYVSTQDLDYLKVIYHLYNSDSEDEEQARVALIKKQEEKKRQREKKIADLRAEKQIYSPGMWNVNSIMLGGLGSDPPVQDADLELKESLNTSSQVDTPASHVDLQKTINAIWNALHIPEDQRLDMAIKYSSNEYRDRLPEAIRMWEKAVLLIQKREKMLAELEMFEREASDPNRFFSKGYNGTSVARMEESKQRKKLYKQMSDTECAIAKILQFIKRTFNDIVSYKAYRYCQTNAERHSLLSDILVRLGEKESRLRPGALAQNYPSGSTCSLQAYSLSRHLTYDLKKIKNKNHNSILMWQARRSKSFYILLCSLVFRFLE
ncbi:coiled-coil domain-containing protein 87 isoform X3 [Lithobates pipiens]